jgi:hypothetical protein
MEKEENIIRTGVRMNASIHEALTTRLRQHRYGGQKRISIDSAINEAVMMWLENRGVIEKKDLQSSGNGVKLSSDTQALIAAYNRVPATVQPDLAVALMRVIDLTISILNRVLDDKQSLETQLVREFSELSEREREIDEIEAATSGSRPKDSAVARGTRRGTQRGKKPA